MQKSIRGARVAAIALLVAAACSSPETPQPGKACNPSSTATLPHYLVAILGQSNAEGIGDAQAPGLDPTLLAPYSIQYDAYNYSYVSVPIAQPGLADPTGTNLLSVYNYGKLQPYWYNVAHVDFGFELTMGRDLDAHYPGRVAITKYAMGGSQLDVHWAPSGTFPNSGGPNFAHLAFNHVLEAYNACGTCDSLIVAWEQGEQDAGHLADASTYAANLAPLVALFRAQWPTAEWVVGRLNSDVINSGSCPYVATVQAQEASYVSGDPKSILVNQDAYPLRADHLHYTDQAYLDLGHAWATSIVAALPNPTGCQ